jgi:hypothetical protein
MRFTGFWLLAAAFPLSLAPALRAQESMSPDAPPPASTAPAPAPEDIQHDTQKLQVNVDLVNSTASSPD